MFFDPAVYSVPEGENQVLVLRTDNEFAVPFTIDVTLRNGTAIGKYIIMWNAFHLVYCSICTVQCIDKTRLCSG